MVYGCHRYFDEIAERYDIEIVRVPGYTDITGNCKADELARRTTIIIELSDEFSNLSISMRTCKFLTDNAFVDSINER